MKNLKEWFGKGEHWVWFSASAVSISVVLVIGLILMITYKGMIYFWPHPVHSFELNTNGKVETIVGELHQQKMKEVIVDVGDGVELKTEVPQYLMKIGNRDVYGIDFRWVDSADIVNQQMQLAENVVVIERYEWGSVYGQFKALKYNTKTQPINDETLPLIHQLLEEAQDTREQINHIEKIIIGGINYQIEGLRLDQKKLELENEFTDEIKAEFATTKKQLNQAFDDQQSTLEALYASLKETGEITLVIAGNKTIQVPISKIVKLWQPNEMSIIDDFGFFFHSIGDFLMEDPREANTEGGVFPAIVGTITMVILMAMFVMPMGVIAAIYMSEYAREGVVLRIVRISINNLAGVPSIVFGIFGLGFFVYIIGGSIDEMFYEYALPNPTFGTPALLWASLTMALLTLPVVIVSTQEGLSRVPKELREGGLALGATKSETIMKIVLPMSLPAVMTGLILAVARAAGEVAPLMLVGVVKLAAELPIDFNEPFIHLERKFMHLGFHIYDVGFQSPNVEASQPLVYATSLLLVVIIVSLNLSAIIIRNRLSEKYKSLSH
jgi:phosphate transport system permease protein